MQIKIVIQQLFILAIIAPSSWVAGAALLYEGPYISFGLGTADASGAFEGFYKSFDTPGVPTTFLNIMLSLPK